MKKFLIKLGPFLFLLYGVIFILKSSVPFHWGSKLLSQKVNLVETLDDVNTLFVGSSRVQRHIDPLLFDKQVKDGTKSFNLGVQGSFLLESLHTLDHFLDHSEKSAKIDKVFYLTRHSIEQIKDENYHTTRRKYFMDFSRLASSVTLSKAVNRSWYRHLIMTIENSLGIGEIFDIAEMHLKKSSKPKKILKNMGFMPYPKNIDSKFAKKQNGKDLPILKGQSRRKALSKGLKPIELEVINEYRLLKEKCNKKGIELYFIHLPNTRLHYFMDDFNNIYLGQGIDFPEYFQYKYRHDEGHLNKAGAKLFTQRLSKKYKQLKAEKPSN